jgi:hypothetical protein
MGSFGLTAGDDTAVDGDGDSDDESDGEENETMHQPVSPVLGGFTRGPQSEPSATPRVVLTAAGHFRQELPGSLRLAPSAPAPAAVIGATQLPVDCSNSGTSATDKLSTHRSFAHSLATSRDRPGSDNGAETFTGRHSMGGRKSEIQKKKSEAERDLARQISSVLMEGGGRFESLRKRRGISLACSTSGLSRSDTSGTASPNGSTRSMPGSPKASGAVPVSDLLIPLHTIEAASRSDPGLHGPSQSLPDPRTARCDSPTLTRPSAQHGSGSPSCRLPSSPTRSVGRNSGPLRTTATPSTSSQASCDLSQQGNHDEVEDEGMLGEHSLMFALSKSPTQGRPRSVVPHAVSASGLRPHGKHRSHHSSHDSSSGGDGSPERGSALPSLGRHSQVRLPGSLPGNQVRGGGAEGFLMPRGRHATSVQLLPLPSLQC